MESQLLTLACINAAVIVMLEWDICIVDWLGQLCMSVFQFFDQSHSIIWYKHRQGWDILND